jgi:hypothetical protein
MTLIDIALWILLAVGIVLAIAATRRVVAEDENLFRTISQLVIVWLLPFIDPLVTLYILSNTSEPGSRQFASAEPPLGDGEYIDMRDAE